MQFFDSFLAAHVFLAGHGSTDWSSFSTVDWMVIGSAALFVVWSIWRAIDLTIHPGELDPEHIKRSVLLDPKSLDVAVSSRALSADAVAQDGGAQ